MKATTVLPWVAMAFTLLIAGAGFYRTVIQSQTITGQNQKQVEKMGSLLSNMMDREMEAIKWRADAENRLDALEEE